MNSKTTENYWHPKKSPSFSASKRHSPRSSGKSEDGVPEKPYAFQDFKLISRHVFSLFEILTMLLYVFCSQIIQTNGILHQHHCIVMFLFD